MRSVLFYDPKLYSSMNRMLCIAVSPLIILGIRVERPRISLFTRKNSPCASLSHWMVASSGHCEGAKLWRVAPLYSFPPPLHSYLALRRQKRNSEKKRTVTPPSASVLLLPPTLCRCFVAEWNNLLSSFLHLLLLLLPQPSWPSLGQRASAQPVADCEPQK